MFVLFFLFALLQLWADPKDPYSLAVREGEPATLVEGCVSAITGDLYLAETDAVVQGYIPLRLPRQYLSGDGKGPLVNWSFINHLEAIYRGGETEHKVTIQEPNGATFAFKCGAEEVYDHFYRKKHTPRFKPPSAQETPGLTNTSQGTISGHSNLKNAYLRLEDEGKYITAYCSDQTTRRYKVHHERKHFKDVFKSEESRKIKYLLESETLPSGHKVLYKYDDGDRLISLRTTSPDTHTTYASATFRYHHKHADKIPHVDIELSDGRKLSYRYEEKDKNFLLRSVVSPQEPEKSILYHAHDKHRGNLVSRIALPELRYFDIDYYDEGKNKVGADEIKIKDRHNPRFLRVKTLKAPVGQDGNPQITHRFYYDIEQRFTDVHDHENARTRYRYSPSMRIEAIERYDTKNQLYHKETFEWSESGDLRSRSFFDNKGSLLFTRRLTYDERGNVLKDELSGNLTGQGGNESYAIKRDYSKDGRDLLLKEEEPNGKTTLFTYHGKTNLISGKFLCEKNQIKKRTFYSYNDQNVLIREMEDDGTTQNPNDFSGMTTRLIKQITPLSSGPYVGMPGTIEEKYGVGAHERLLKKTVLTYTTGGKVAQQDIYDATGSLRYSLKSTYDALGRLLSESNALGQVATYAYDAVGNCITATESSGRRIKTMRYDHSNRLTQVEERGFDAIVRTTHCTYDGKHNKTSEADAFGNTTRYSYDSFGHVLETHLPECLDEKGSKVAPVVKATYDSGGREITRTDAKGHTTTKRYNARSQVTHIMHPDGTEERFVYNLDGALKTQIDAEGQATQYTYDVFGRRTSMTDPNGHTTRYTYNAFHLISVEDAEGYVTTYTYDPAGRKIAEKRQGETTQYIDYDELGRICCVRTGDLHQHTTYDLLNRVIEEQQTDATSGRLYAYVRYTYDEAGNKQTIRRPIMHAEQEERFEYDSFDRQIVHVDALGETRTLYDEHHTNSLGQRVLQKTTTDALGQKTIQTHDSQGQCCCIEIQNRAGDTCSLEEKYYDRSHNIARQVSTLFPQQTKREITWDYNSKNQLIALNEPLGKTTRYTYTPKGLLKETIKPDGVTLTREYDRSGNLTALSSSDRSISYAFTYNKLSQLLTATDLITKQTTIRTLDHQGRLLSEKLGNDLTLSNTYDLTGRRTQLTLPDGSTVTYAHDAAHLRQVSRHDPSGTCQYIHRYELFDHSHHLVSSRPIGDLDPIAYTIAPHGACSSISSPYFSQTVDAYDAVGNILSVTTQSQMHAFAYDDLYQLTHEDGASYTYDSHHNRLQKNDEAYSLNALNQHTSATYDPNGNLLASADTHYTYDALDRLISITTPTTHLTFTYDSFNRRLSKTVQGQTLFFLYDGQNEIGATHTDGRIAQLRILGAAPHAEIGAAIAIELDSRIYAPIHDLFGNVATLIPLDGSSPQHYTYDSFGNHSTTFNANPWRFASKRQDETGLVYFGRRYYDPSLGRWTTADPIGFKGGINLYAFVQNNPLLHHDLYGLSIHTDGFLSLPTPTPSAHLVASSSPSKQLASAPSPSSTDHAPHLMNTLAAAGAAVQGAVGAFLTHPYVQGPLQAFGGFSEASIGGGMVLASQGAFGWPLIVHGLDQFTAGLNTVLTARPKETLTSQLLQKTGMPAHRANMIDSGTSLTGSTGGIAVIRYAQTIIKPIVRLPVNLGVPSFQESVKLWPSAAQGRQVINGIEYSTHALERMAPRGLIQKGNEVYSRGVPPSVVENAIKFGAKSQGNTANEVVYIFEGVRVVTNADSTRIITVYAKGK